jgi:capsular polysaccharide biosynthesis protein
MLEGIMKQRVSYWWHRRTRPPPRRAATGILRWVPISSRIGGIPRGVIWDAAEWIRETEARPHAAGSPSNWQRKVRDSERITGPAPQTLDGQVPPVFDLYRTYLFPELSVTCIARGRIATSEGTVISPDDRVFDQFTHQWGDPIWRNKVFEQPGLGRLERRVGTWATLIVPASGINVGHWLMDGVLRLAVLEAAGAEKEARLIVPDTKPKYTQPLEALGYGPDRYDGLREGHWEVERLLVPSYLAPPGFIRPWAGRWIRTRLGVENGKPGTRRLWISRSRARYRRLQNEEVIFRLLEKAGFEEVELEGLSFRKQVSLLSQAEAVAGPHGAGMTNLLFVPRGARILELFPPGFINPVFYSMAISLDQEYYYLVGYSEPEDRNAEGARDLDHFRVDPEKMVRILRRMKLQGA